MKAKPIGWEPFEVILFDGNDNSNKETQRLQFQKFLMNNT